MSFVRCSMFFVLVVFCVCGCGMWRRGRVRRPSDPRTPSSMPRASSYTSWCQPPQYSRCSSFLLPPPYSEVTAKPELYPLVLSYNMDGNKITNGSYYVVQQFRNYLINPLSSLSGTSNEEALGSNLLDDTISDVSYCYWQKLCLPL
ncbi:uncharacterized protein LOC113473900 isoform X1 [Diaphorina citri]|uniref:Uncharacterized protein LOC113473900 isoform X1 n=1 Tax=Diaphorina citri TaxID=121845 RepID=A0A3Q0JLB1_DIACI|nr:uncharacterized protein LOC113473900 isoform X1 [Diaphorina citri]